MEWIKPGTKFDFMGKRAMFVGASTVVCVVSLIGILIFGFNFGVDFKGGTVITVAFQKASNIDRGDLEKTVAETIEAKAGVRGSETGVQDYQAGAGAEADKTKYMVYTEVTSLLTPDKVAAITKALQEAFGADARVENPEESDKFYVALAAEKPILDTNAKLSDLFAKAGFDRVRVRSDREEELDTEFYKELNLKEAEAKEAGGSTTDLIAEQIKAHEAKKQSDLAQLNDAKFTVTLNQLNAMLEEALKSRFQDAFIGVESSTAVSSSVGSTIFAEAMLALLYSMLGMLIYISIRFDIRFGPGALIALVHDSLITMGIFSVFQIKFTLPIVAAILTIIGYSVNDTIVVFDRIRENMEKMKTGLTDALVNKSVNETLSRTIMTTFVTLLTVWAIEFLGGGVLASFGLALNIGFIVGTYSSIFIASPIAVWLDRYFTKRSQQKTQVAA